MSVSNLFANKVKVNHLNGPSQSGGFLYESAVSVSWLNIIHIETILNFV